MQIYIQKIECFNGIKPTIFDENLKRKIPNGWKAIKINQLASIYSGYPFDSSNYDQGGSYKLIHHCYQHKVIHLSLENYID